MRITYDVEIQYYSTVKLDLITATGVYKCIQKWCMQ